MTSTWPVRVAHLDTFGGRGSFEHQFGFGVVDRGNLVGFMEVRVVEPDNIAHVQWVEVDPSYRRKGVARAMYHELYQWAAREGFQVEHGMTTDLGTATLEGLSKELESYRQHNPVIPRIEYVTKTYPDFVVVATLSAWAEAVGQHGLREHAMRIFHDGPEDDVGRVIRVLPRLMKEWKAPADTPFDRYLPWVAREFNRIYKPYKKAARRRGLPSFPAHFDMASLTLGRITPENEPVSREIVQLRDDTRILRDRFGSVANWAAANNVDLNRYTWEQAITLAAEWAEAREIEGIPQGKIVYEFDDGWTVQELGIDPHLPTAQAELNAEGDIMQHCLDTYDAREAGKLFRIFSLRDPKGRPHTTMEWYPHERYVVQLRGKQNDAPQQEYLERMTAFRDAVLDPLTGWTPVDDDASRPYDVFATPLVATFSDPDRNKWFLFQDRNDGGHLYSEKDLHSVNEWILEWLDGHWEPPMDIDPDDTDALDEAYQEAFREAAGQLSITDARTPGGYRLHDGPIPEALEWFVFREHGVKPTASEDEMIHWMVEGEYNPQCRFLGRRAANKAQLLAIPRRGIL